MSSIYIHHTGQETIFCEVSPGCKDYGRIYPVYVLHSDGSWSRTKEDQPYFRSKPYTLRKPHTEYTVSELAGILHEVKGTEISKEFATHCYNDNLRLALEILDKNIKEDPEYVLKHVFAAMPGTFSSLEKHITKMEKCRKHM